MLILPGTPDFDYTLSTCPPPGSHGGVYVASVGSGLLREVSPESEEFLDYLMGGEYDERLAEIEDFEDE
jgi:hypothetical protein